MTGTGCSCVLISRGTWCTWREMEELYIILFIYRP